MATTKKKTAVLSSAPKALNSDLERLVNLTHSDPHSFLGIRSKDDSVLVRIFRPDAVSVSLLLEGQKEIPISHGYPGGLFEGHLDKKTPLLPYRVKVTYANGANFTYWDPYSFWPTLGDLDLHLLGEGNHEKLHEKLGAHFRKVQGVEGVSFAVWAPSAGSVSVVGDFNSWDGRLNPMRRLGRSGIWELFIPELPQGTRYKFEIHTPGGGLLLKADPYAFATEKPPLTASVVYQSHYEFNDQEWMEKRRSKNALREPLSIYELHLESWKKVPDEGNRALTYREMAVELADYVTEMGFTHVELMPVMNIPLGAPGATRFPRTSLPRPVLGSPTILSTLWITFISAASGFSWTGCRRTFPRTNSRWAALTARRFTSTWTRNKGNTRTGEPMFSTLAATR